MPIIDNWCPKWLKMHFQNGRQNRDIKYDLNLKNQAKVFKFEIMDAIYTRIKNIEKKIFRS